MLLVLVTTLLACAINAYAQANIPVFPLAVDDKPYFSDPYHVPYENETSVYISGTNHKYYLKCDGELTSKCATHTDIKWNDTELAKQAKNAKAQICSVAGVHPFQTISNGKKSWDAAVTLHVQKSDTECEGLTGWSMIVHAHPEGNKVDTPPTSWIGDQVLVGSFTETDGANYDGKYFRTPEGKLYLVYQKQIQPDPNKRDAVVAWPMDNPTTLTGSHAKLLLAPEDGLNSENYHNHKDDGFKLIETGNIRAINGKFLMAYSVGAYNRPTYKLAVAYSDTFVPENGTQYRKVMKENPDELWGTTKPKEVYYLLQADAKHENWHYIKDQVLAPGVPTVAKIGADDTWVLMFAGYRPDDAPMNGTDKYDASYRRPFFIDLDVNVPSDISVKQASDQDLQGWITPVHKQTSSGMDDGEL